MGECIKNFENLTGLN